MLAEVPIISCPAEATASWLTAALTGCGAAPAHARVRRVTHERLGSGHLAHCARLHMEWADAGDTTLPRSLVAKFPSRHTPTRQAGWESGAYLREVAFYTELACRARVNVPDCYVAAADRFAGGFVLLLSNVAPVRTAEQVAGGSVADIALALGQAARLHASFWNGTGLASPHWLWDGAQHDRRRLGAAYRLLVPRFLSRFGGRLSGTARSALIRLNASLREWMHSRSKTTTMVHGDFRLDNLLFSTGAPRATVIDWQTVTVGCGTDDAAYLIGGSLETAARRAHETDLFRLYYEALLGQGVAVSWADCWQSYRASALAGLQMTVVGAMLVEADSRSDEMFRVVVERHAAHAADLDAFAAMRTAG
jgi:hypothetical protein